MQNLSTLLIFLLFFLPALAIQAANSSDVIINEIAWMGTQTSYSDEWIELYNNTNSSINLEGWTLKALDETPEINLTGIIPAKGFYLLERTDDNTIPNISADQIYKGALENSGEVLELYDNLTNLIDSLNCDSGWLAGDNNTKQTMERVSALNWQNSQNAEGTPKAENSLVIEIKQEATPPSSEKPQPPKEESSEVEPRKVYPLGVVINEVLPSPEGPDAEEEWFEIFNQNIFEVNLSKWQVTDVAGATKIYTFPEGTVIKPKEYLVLSRPFTKITLNNSGDGLKLIQPDGKIIDSIDYGKASRGESFSRTESGWVWTSTLTPGAVNIIPTKAAEPKEETEEEKGLAAISEPLQKIQDKQIPKSFLVFLIAGVLAIFSGIIILALKRKLKSGYNKNI